MADFFIGTAVEGLPIGRSSLTRLVKLIQVEEMFTEFSLTLVLLMRRLAQPNASLAGPDGLQSDEAQLRQAVSDFLQGSVVTVAQGVNTYRYHDDLLVRLFKVHLFAPKKRQRGVFIPGVRRSRNRNAQFMRIRVPHS